MMSSEKEKTSQTQMNLFGHDELAEIEEKPRPKNIPASQPKNTESSASVFGWRFQIVVGIVLSLKNVSSLKSVEIEGATEDIELYFEDKEPEYVQVKAIQEYYGGAPEKATLAMNTLINTSNLTEGKYSRLIYVSNFRNPLNLSESLMKASWQPDMRAVFTRKYNSLPVEARNFIQERIKLAQGQLRGKYTDSIKFFDLNKLYISTILFGPDSQDEQRYSVLESTIESVFGKLNVNLTSSKIDKIKNMLIDRYFENAGSKQFSKRHEIITKEKLVWRIIFQIVDDVSDDFYENIPAGMENDLDIYAQQFIKKQSEDINVINKIYAELSDFLKGSLPTKRNCADFIASKWTNFKDDFPLNEDLQVQEYGVKMLMQRIIEGKHTIRKITKGVGL